eukprot:GHVU01200987.1.p1 GENE.GHVU01200987.1~~GHVU01200987.1.p1  ORF type:complete len:133 (-),score=11.95 GHVU01200987.1:115-513(-)
MKEWTNEAVPNKNDDRYLGIYLSRYLSRYHNMLFGVRFALSLSLSLSLSLPRLSSCFDFALTSQQTRLRVRMTQHHRLRQTMRTDLEVMGRELSSHLPPPPAPALPDQPAAKTSFTSNPGRRAFAQAKNELA